MNNDINLLKIFNRLNKLVKNNDKFKINKYNFLSIIFYDLKECDPNLLSKNESFYEIYFKEKNYILNFVEKLEELIDFKPIFNNFFIENDNLYYNNELIENINYFEKDKIKQNIIRILFIQVPLTKTINYFVKIESTPIYFLMIKSCDKEFKKLKTYLLKIKNELMIWFMNLPESIYDYNYLPIQIFEILNYLISEEFNSDDCLKKLKDKKPLDKKYQNLYEELINYL